MVSAAQNAVKRTIAISTSKEISDRASLVVGWRKLTAPTSASGRDILFPFWDRQALLRGIPDRQTPADYLCRLFVSKTGTSSKSPCRQAVAMRFWADLAGSRAVIWTTGSVVWPLCRDKPILELCQSTYLRRWCKTAFSAHPPRILTRRSFSVCDPDIQMRQFGQFVTGQHNRDRA